MDTMSEHATHAVKVSEDVVRDINANAIRAMSETALGFATLGTAGAMMARTGIDLYLTQLSAMTSFAQDWRREADRSHGRIGRDFNQNQSQPPHRPADAKPADAKLTGTHG